MGARGSPARQVARLERGASPLQGAVDRGDARLQQLGSLGRLPAEHLAEDQHRALLRRQVLQSRDEREPDRLARDCDVGGIAVVVQHERVGHRLDPGHFGERREIRLHRLSGRAEIHRSRSSLTACDHVQADVRRDPVEPRAQRRAALEPAQALPGAEQRLLDGVLGLEGRAEHAIAVAGELAAVDLERALELAAGEDRACLRHRAIVGDQLASRCGQPPSCPLHGKQSVATATAGAFRDLPRRRRGSSRGIRLLPNPAWRANEVEPRSGCTAWAPPSPRRAPSPRRSRPSRR